MLKLKATLEIERIERDGRREVRELDVNSWLKAYAQFCHGNWADLAGALGPIITSPDGTTFIFEGRIANEDKFRADATATTTTHGIWVGTGSTAVDRDDYTLGTKIDHGNGAGQLYYQACVVTAIAAISGGYEVVISRQFDNNSGSAITINEVGLVVITADYYGATKFMMVLRDLISGGEAVANGGSVVIRYKLQWTA